MRRGIGMEERKKISLLCRSASEKRGNQGPDVGPWDWPDPAGAADRRVGHTDTQGSAWAGGFHYFTISSMNPQCREGK